MTHWARLFRDVIELEDREKVCDDCSAKGNTHCTDYDKFLCLEGERKCQASLLKETQK